MTPKLGNALLASALVCLIFTTAQAQSNSGSIVGTIKNTGGEVISGAQITVTQVQTNKQFSATTNSEGYYVSPPLAVGEYRVEARMTGFRRAVYNGITIQIQQTAVVDFTLDVGEVSEQVEITAQAPVL